MRSTTRGWLEYFVFTSGYCLFFLCALVPRKAATDMGSVAADGGGGGFPTPYRRRSLESVGESVGRRVKV